MSKKKKRRQKSENVSQPRRFQGIVFGVSLTVVVIAVMIGAISVFWPKRTSKVTSPDRSSNSDSSSANVPREEEHTAASGATKSADQQRLVGRWLRPDGGYILEIRSASEDGKLEARYFNPKPINVARAQWQPKEGKLQILVELRDVNYPGSTYSLEFNSAEDRMTGNYYQATQRANFDVEFVRQN